MGKPSDVWLKQKFDVIVFAICWTSSILMGKALRTFNLALVESQVTAKFYALQVFRCPIICETLSLRIHAFEMKCFRRLFRISYRRRTTSSEAGVVWSCTSCRTWSKITNASVTNLEVCGFNPHVTSLIIGYIFVSSSKLEQNFFKWDPCWV